MAKTSAPVQSTRTAPNPVTIYEDLLSKGFSKEESAMHVAQLCGLQTSCMSEPIEWKIEDISNLLFLAHRASKKGRKEG